MAPKDFFQHLADGAPVMIWMSGLDMGCFYFNRAWLDFRGRTLEQEYGNGWAEGVHPEDMERCVNHYVSCFERRMAFAMSYRLQNAQGAYRWILDRGAPHYDVSGDFLGFFGGCAEIENDTLISRNAGLGQSMVAMQSFAREQALVARDQLATANSGSEQLETLARTNRTSLEKLRRTSRAAADMEQLAQDMARYADIGRGACLT
jgi:PAS domain S-box-containing protein